jgi:hypothetical protein
MEKDVPPLFKEEEIMTYISEMETYSHGLQNVN